VIRINPTVSSSRNWATLLHANQTDKLGAPFIDHVERVVENLKKSFVDFTDDQLHAAYLHDVIEDCGVTKADLLDKGYTDTVADTVELLTKPKDEMSNSDYAEWVKSIIDSANVDAVRVKFCDISDNLNNERLSLLATVDRDRLNKKYTEPFRMLLSAVL
tara:strand:- start:8060 stop:8539 length:480 start_codon:yes stop_codon:yes gene_type:complete